MRWELHSAVVLE